MGAEARRGAASPPSVQAGTGAGGPRMLSAAAALRGLPPPAPSLAPLPRATRPAAGPRPPLPAGGQRASDGTSSSPPRVSPDSGREVLRLAKKVSEGSPQGLGAL